ncbi:MAG: ABC transporter ATP-binding protein [Deltaproteobacteria bacterium]|nr:ABC transporter ATP-binding protein [Deltaproteobacteria bacterium]
MSGSVVLKGLVKTYPGVVAVDHLSMDIREGEFMTFLGASGSGKTTTLSMIAGLTLPTSGEILLNGQDVTFIPPHKRNIGMVFQNYALFPHMTVYENIAFPLKMHKVSKEEIAKRVTQALHMVQLPQHGDRYPSQLSGGQQQRIALARALSFEPGLILMDEPLGALDKKLRQHMQIEIKHIQEDLGFTTIYVTHDQEEALTMSDRIAVLRDGKLEQLGTPEELYEEPKTLYVADFIGESNIFKADVLEVGEERLKLQLPGGQSFYALRCSETVEGPEVSVAIRPEKFRVLSASETVSEEYNVFEGIIKEVIYFGESSKYSVEIGKDVIIIVKQPNFYPATKVGVGDQLTLSVHWRSCRTYCEGLSL